MDDARTMLIPPRRVHRRLLLLTPLLVEWAAVRKVVPSARVLRTGLGAAKASAAAQRIASFPADAVAVLGFAGALTASLQPGDVVVASEVRGPEGASVVCPSQSVVASLRALGVSGVSVGPIVSVDHVVYGRERHQLAHTGALAVDMESAWLAAAAAGRPCAVVRVILDVPTHGIAHPARALRSGLVAWWALRRVAVGLRVWATEWAWEAVRDRPAAP